MNKRIQEMVEAMEGKKKPKGKRYVDSEEYKKITGKDAEEEEALNDSSEEEEDEEDTGRKGKLFGRGLTIAIAIKAKKAKEKE